MQTWPPPSERRPPVSKGASPALSFQGGGSSESALGASALLFGSAFSMQRLDGQSDALAAADAQRDQAALETVTPHRVNEFCREHRARRANRVAVGDRTALDIHNVIGQSEFARDHNGDGGKGFIDLNPLDGSDIPASALQRLFDRGNRS